MSDTQEVRRFSFPGRFADWSGLPPMIAISIAVGCVAGVGAYAFRHLIGLIHNLSFRQVLNSVYEVNDHTAVTDPVWLPVLTLPLGAVIVTWLVRTFAPEARGHGVPEVLNAVHFQRARIRPVVVLVKALASSISIGTGGSVGREGPIVQIGSAFGSWVGNVLDVGRADRTLLLAAGAGAGIAATFNAPLGGVLFAVELFLLRLTYRTVGLVVLAVVPATFIGRSLMGAAPAFNIPALQYPDFGATTAELMLAFGIFGIVVGAFSALFIRGLYWVEDLIEGIRINEYLRNALGMALVGGILVVMHRQAGYYYVEGVGYATILDILKNTLSDPGLLLSLALLKLAVTAMTIGFGGSGGIFSPSLFMGACLGAWTGAMLDRVMPGLGVSIPNFALIGMASMTAATTGAFFASVVMLTEMSGDSNVVVSVMLSASVAWVVRHAICKPSIYNLKLLRRGLVVPEIFPSNLLAGRTVGEVMAKAAIADGRSLGPKDDVAGAVIELHGSRVVLGGPDHGGMEGRSYILAQTVNNLSETLVRRDQEARDLVVVQPSAESPYLFVISNVELAADYVAMSQIQAGK